MRLADLLPGSVLAPLTAQIKSSLRASHLKFKGGFHNFGRGPARGTGGLRGAHWLIQRERGGGWWGYSDIKRFLPHSPTEGTSRPEKSWWPNARTDWKFPLNKLGPQRWHGVQIGNSDHQDHFCGIGFEDIFLSECRKYFMYIPTFWDGRCIQMYLASDRDKCWW